MLPSPSPQMVLSSTLGFSFLCFPSISPLGPNQTIVRYKELLSLSVRETETYTLFLLAASLMEAIVLLGISTACS